MNGMNRKNPMAMALAWGGSRRTKRSVSGRRLATAGGLRTSLSILLAVLLPALCWSSPGRAQAIDERWLNTGPVTVDLVSIPRGELVARDRLFLVTGDTAIAAAAGGRVALGDIQKGDEVIVYLAPGSETRGTPLAIAITLMGR